MFSRMVQNSLELKLKTTKMDQNVRFIILEANVQDHPFPFVNFYTPNKITSNLYFQVKRLVKNWITIV